MDHTCIGGFVHSKFAAENSIFCYLHGFVPSTNFFMYFYLVFSGP